ncbi:MAG: hypothetical protein NXI20_00505 [bacterium]|nr:hypothetical protein [bacterium]
MKLKHHLFLISTLIVILFSQCATREDSDILKGELAFKLIGTFTFYGVPDSVSQPFMSMIDSISNDPSSSNNDSSAAVFFKTLEKNGLLHEPYFNILLGDSSQMSMVIVDENEYKKIEQYKLNDLERNNQKVKLSIRGKLMPYGYIDCQEIISVDLVKGETYWEK